MNKNDDNIQAVAERVAAEFKNVGGPAFPAHTPINPTGDAMRINHGMTLRDYFAGQALLGMLTHDNTPYSGATIDSMATFAYRHADAMLAERDK